MAWFSFLDWIDVSQHLADKAPQTLAVGDSPSLVFRDYVRGLNKDAAWTDARHDLAVLDRMATREDAMRVGVRVDKSGLVAIAVQTTDEERIDGEEPDASVAYVAYDARLTALLIVNFLSRCLSGEDRLPMIDGMPEQKIVVPTTTVWPVQVKPSTSKAKTTPEKSAASAVIRRALKGTLTSEIITRDTPGWTPALQQKRPAIDALSQQFMSTVEQHYHRIEGSLRNEAADRFPHIELRTSESLVKRLYHHVTKVALFLGGTWLTFMVLTWLLKNVRWFSVTFNELLVWTLCLVLVTLTLLYATLKTHGPDLGGGGYVSPFFRSPARLWALGLVPLVLACVFAVADVAGLLGFGQDGYGSGSNPKSTERRADYGVAIKNVIWVLPVPLLVALLQAQGTFGSIVATESKIQRQRRVITRLQDVLRDGQRATKRLGLLVAGQNGGALAICPADFEGLMTRLTRASNEYKARHDNAQKRFEAKTGMAALVALLATVLQGVATFRPTDETTSASFLLNELKAQYSPHDADCLVEYPDTESRHASMVDAVFMMQVFGCLDVAERKATVRAAESDERFSRFDMRLASMEANLGKLVEGPWSPPDAPDVAVDVDVEGLSDALEKVSDELAAFQQTLSVPVALDRRRFNEDLEQLRRELGASATDVSIGVSLSTSGIDDQISAVEEQLKSIPDRTVMVTLDDTALPGQVDDANKKIDELTAAPEEADKQNVAGEPETVTRITYDFDQVLEVCDLHGEYRFDSDDHVIRFADRADVGWFDEGTRDAAGGLLDRVVKAHVNGSLIYVFGIADPTGSALRNQLLSKQRAEAVAAAVRNHASFVGSDVGGPIPFGIGANGWLLGLGLPTSIDDPLYRSAHIFVCQEAIGEFVKLEDRP
ncbi:hypothetical protein [uncultured Roseobacter sp.]|uniref:hypothetical protein n=1 Tax=uncultured Roseobacter sp. TaxID=114847 RepID=UPI002626BC57|nr:hypothetical protein [uncultured Roseobacter sp.]